MLYHVARPNFAHAGHVVIKAGAAALERHAKRIKLFAQPTNANPQHETTVRDEVEACRLLGHVNGIHLGQYVHPGG